MQITSIRKRLLQASAIALIAATLPLSATGQETPETGDETETLERPAETIRYDGEIVSTGTRLLQADPSARIIVITAEEIKARGVATAEEIMRTIPQHFSTISNTTNLNPDLALDVVLGDYGLGTSTANLRGLGSANTLVLVNGRRISGAAGRQDFFANLRDIPAASIERIEVSLDGGSAIYGADAVAGVINFILKKNYRGLSLTGRYENSNTDADQYNASATGGYGWNSGTITGTVSYTKSDPINNAKTGFVTRDYRSMFGDFSSYDFRSPSNLRSGGIARGVLRPGPPDGRLIRRFPPFPQIILPVGDDGRNAVATDFVPITPDDSLDFINENAGGGTEDWSVSANLVQEIGSKLELRGDVLWAESKTNSKASPGSGALASVARGIPVPASNAFNPFGEEVQVYYNPATEVAAGLLPEAEQFSTNEQFRFTIGFDYAISDKIKFVVDYTQSESTAFNEQIGFGRVGIDLDALRANPETQPPPLDPQADARVEEVLASSDPDIAVNLFGDGTGQNPSVADLYVPLGTATNGTQLRELTGYLTGEAFNLPAGTVSYVAGGEWRRESLPTISALFTNNIGVPEPKRDLYSVFGEILIPVIGSESNSSFGESLVLTAQARYDEYTTEGADGRDDNGDPNIVTAKFDNISPRLGFSYVPVDGFRLRGSWSEGFRAPTFSDLFTTNVVLTDEMDPRMFGLPFFFVFDPLTGQRVEGASETGSNIDLQPETSDTIDMGLTLTPPSVDGLRFDVDYSWIDFRNRIASNFELGQLLPPEIYGNLEEFFIRDDQGNLLRVINRPVNISRRVSETIDFDLSYSFDTRHGTFEPGVNYHVVIKQFDQAVEGSAEASFVGESIGIDKSKLEGRLNWYKDDWSADLYVRRTPGYLNTDFEDILFPRSIPIPNMEVDSRTVVDLSVRKSFDNGLRVRAGGRNILNADFPFMLSSNGQPYDANRVDLRGRVFFVELTYEFSFDD